MKAFVTGGTGFVGRPFVRRILREGWDVTLVTRNRQNAGALGDGNLTVCEADVADEKAMRRIALRGDRFDAVFHLAASLNYFGSRQELYKTNVQGTRNVLDLAMKTGAKKFVYASSIEAVGPVKRKDVPAPPHQPCRPISPYGEAKALAEQLVISAARRHFPAVVLRIGNVYGRGHFSFIVDIAEAILSRNRLLEFLPVYGDRYIHPVHNDDVTEGILAAHRCIAHAPTVTLAGEYATISELFRICADSLGKQVRIRERKRIDEVYLRLRCAYHRHRRHMDFITYLMAGPGKRVHRACSMDETRDVLGFTPQVSLKRGIADTLNWAREAGLLSSCAGEAAAVPGVPSPVSRQGNGGCALD